MQTRAFTKRQITLPRTIHRQLDIRAADPITGLPALTVGPDAPVLSSKEIEEILADFP
jgi:hypothetical protein